MTGSVESAVRRHISAGQVLNTPDIYKGAPFEIGRIDAQGMILLLGANRTPTKIPWTCLEGIPVFLREKGWVEVGTVYDTSAKSGTLDSYLKGWIKRATAGWVAAVLEKAGVVEIDRNRPLRVRLKE